MQFSSVLLSVALAVSSVWAAECDLAALAPLATGPAANQCSKDSGVSFLPPTMLTADQMPKLCASSACQELMAKLKKAAPNECTISLTNPPTQLYKDLLTPLEASCATTAAPPVTTTAAPGATTAAPSSAPAPTPAPAPAPGLAC